MKSKEYKQPLFLISFLESQKGLKSRTIPSTIFDELTYFDLFSPYFDFIASSRSAKTNHRTFPKNTDYKVYQSLLLVDEYMSSILHLYIGTFEKRIRTFVITQICDSLCHSGDKTCSNSNPFNHYDDGKEALCLASSTDFTILSSKLEPRKKALDPNKILEKENKISEKRKKAVKKLADCYGSSCLGASPIERHYNNIYHCIPAFIGMHSLTFGTISVLFGLLPRESQEEFWQQYCRRQNHKYSDVELSSFLSRLKRIVDLRNVVNHYEPLFPFICGIADPSFNSFCTIIKRLKSNHELSKTALTISLNKPSLPCSTANQYNVAEFKKISKILDII